MTRLLVLVSLLDQERPNIFTNQIANIGPGETVVVQIEYQEAIRQSGGVFSLRVPMVVGPRYNPPAKVDVWGPVWSNLAFLVVVLAASCAYVYRKDF